MTAQPSITQTGRDASAPPSSVGPAFPSLADSRHSHGAPSARNLLVTVFGDVMLPAGPATEVSVGTLHELLADFDVNERLVRTSLSRLAADGLVVSRSLGRRSLYRIASAALATFRDATERIYTSQHSAWDGTWTIVIVDPGFGDADGRLDLRTALGSAGFATAAPNVLVSPVHAPELVGEVGRRFTGARAIATRGPLHPGDSLVDDRELAAISLDLPSLADRYRVFIERFESVVGVDPESLTPSEAWKLRVLVVAGFRRIALLDPNAPAELLPVDWPGHRARQLAASLYRAVAPLADDHLANTAGLAVRTPPDRFEVSDSPPWAC